MFYYITNHIMVLKTTVIKIGLNRITDRGPAAHQLYNAKESQHEYLSTTYSVDVFT